MRPAIIVANLCCGRSVIDSRRDRNNWLHSRANEVNYWGSSDKPSDKQIAAIADREAYKGGCGVDRVRIDLL
jgi:hypothetical protein